MSQFFIITTLFIVVCIFRIRTSHSLIDKVHVVFSNHLDVGYHRGWDVYSCAWNEACTIHSVLNEYWHYYWPLAISIASRLENKFPNNLINKTIRFNYLTFPYMMSLYLDCDINNKFNLKCPTNKEKNNILNGIKKGYIWFNSFPFNSQLEDYDSSLLEFGIKLSYDIMNKTGLPIKYHSTVISQRDVPGLPRNFIPILTKNGIRAVSVGANGGTPILINDKVSTIFKWFDPNSNESIYVLYHSKGYGGFKIEDAAIIPGFNQALIYAWNSDNIGPFLEPEILTIYETLEQEFKAYNKDENHEIEIVSSTFDIYLDELLSFNNKSVIDNIPIYSGEIGDRWSYGIQSDPFKNAAYRNAMKLRAKCLNENKCSLHSPAFYNFSRLLIKNGEHTWGASLKKALDSAQGAPGYSTYYNKQFLELLYANNSMNNFTQMRQTWDEQRDYGLYFALEALSYSNDLNDINLYHDILNEWNNRLHNVSSPNLVDYKIINNKNNIFSFCNDSFNLQFNESNGAISMLYDKINNIHYANVNGSTDNNLAQFWYQAINQSLKGTAGNIRLPNIYLTTYLFNIYQNINDYNKLIIEMNFGGDINTQNYNNLCVNYSCINRIYNEFQFDCKNKKIEMNLNIINKTFTRIPETLYFSFVPYRCINWTISSYGKPIKLNNIIGQGSWNIYSYGINGNITCQFIDNLNYYFNVESIDIGLTSFKPITYPNKMAENQWLWASGYVINSSQTDGFAFTMFNNMWDTNYPQWYPYNDIDQNITYNVVFYL